MRQVKKTKLYKGSLFLLGMMVLINFSFCLMPLTVFAQILEKQENPVLQNVNESMLIPDLSILPSLDEPIPEIFQRDNQLSEEEDCTETEPAMATPYETETDQNNTKPSKNTVLPCCQDHEKITEIDNVPNLKINNPIFYATPDENLLDPKALIQDSSSIQSLDLPPPKADVLSSVFKKE